MSHSLATRIADVRRRLTARTSNAWTRTTFEPAVARRIAGLRYWDGAVS
jgi:phage protein D